MPTNCASCVPEVSDRIVLSINKWGKSDAKVPTTPLSDHTHAIWKETSISSLETRDVSLMACLMIKPDFPLSHIPTHTEAERQAVAGRDPRGLVDEGPGEDHDGGHHKPRVIALPAPHGDVVHAREVAVRSGAAPCLARSIA